MHNCDLVNLEDMLQNGTVISGTMIEKPHSFSTACNIATQIIAQVASNQYGGQTITLTHLAPFVQVSRGEDPPSRLWRGGAVGNVKSPAPQRSYPQVVEERLRAEIQPRRPDHSVSGRHPHDHQRSGSLHHRVHVSERGAKCEQEKKDLAVIIEEMLLQRCEGVKNETGVWITPAFPKLIYVLEEDNVRGGHTVLVPDRGWPPSAPPSRMVPDYISEKKMLELKIDKNGEGHCYTCMGCRTFLTPYVDETGKPKYYGRFNQGVVTINLVDVALSSGKRSGEVLEDFRRAPGAVPPGPHVPPQPAQGHPLRCCAHFVAVRRIGPPPEGRAH